MITNLQKIMRRIFTIFIVLFFVLFLAYGDSVKATPQSIILAVNQLPLPTIISGMTSVLDQTTSKTIYGGFTGNEAVLNLPGSFEEGEGQTILGGDGTFSPMNQYGAGSWSWTVTTGYFDNDNYIDLVVSNNNGGNPGTVTFLHGNGDGTFTKRLSFGTGAGPYMIATGDFDGNGEADIAVANTVSNTVSVLLGNGDGTFKPKVDYPVGGGAYTIVANDFNGNGVIDLAVADMGTGLISVLIGKGDGKFNVSVDYPVVAGSRSVVSGDFNNDGNIDLVSSNQSFDPNTGIMRPGLSTISILIGRGDGTFEACRNYSTGDGPYFITKGDFNGDGNLDIATANGVANTVSISIGDGAGGFTRRPDIPTGGGFAISIISGDFNTDGKADLVVTNVSSGNVTVMLGNGDGTFSAGRFSSGSSTHSLTSGDFNKDGKIDLVIANYGTGKISVLLGKGVPPGTTGTGYDLFGFLKGNLDNCLRGIVLIQNSSNCYVSNTYSNNMRVMTSRTYIEGKDNPLFEIATLVQKNAALVVGDVSLGGMDPNDFAYWGRNLAQGSGTSSSADSFWGLNSYPNNPNAQANLSGTQFSQYAAKITDLKGEASTATSLSTGPWYLQTSDPANILNPDIANSSYPQGRVWNYDGNLTILTPIQFKGKGTIIVDGNLTIDANQNIKPLDSNSTLGLIVLGNVIFSGNNTVNAAIFAAGSTLTGGAGGDMRFNGDDVNLIGSFVAASFAGIPGRSNISFYYDKNLGSSWPPGFGSLNMPHPTEN